MNGFLKKSEKWAFFVARSAFLLLLTVQLLLLSFLVLPANAQDRGAHFEGGAAGRGETVTLFLTVDGAVNARSGSLSLDYDPSALCLLSAEWQIEGALLESFDLQKGLGAFVCSEERALEGSIFTVTFRVTEDCPSGAIPVGGILKLKDGGGETLSLDLAGSVLVYDGIATLEGGSVRAGEQLFLALVLEEELPVKSGSLRVSCDPALLKVESAEFAVENSVIAHFDKEKGLGAFICSSEQMLKGTVLYLTVSVAEDADFESTDLLFELELKDGEGRVYTLLMKGATLTLQKGDPMDLDGNGSVTIGDVTKLLNYIAGADLILSPYGQPDINKDGKVTISDVTVLLNRIAGVTA